MGVRATVANGRLVVDGETPLRDGTVVEFVIDDEGDELDAQQRRALDEAIAAGFDEAERGLAVPAADVLARLRARREG